MPTLDRRLVFGTGAGAMLPGLLLSLLIARPNLLADAWQVPCLKPMFPEEQRREASLNRQHDAVRRRMESRRAVLRELVDGHRTLLETAARFRDIDRNAPEFNWPSFREATLEATDEERHCREVIEHLRAWAPLGVGPTEEMAQRLERELAELLARGPVCLPESKQ